MHVARGATTAVAIVLAATALALGLSNRHLHHWDEFAFVYAAANYTPAALGRGEFEVTNIVGFFDAKLGHLACLHTLLGAFGTSRHALAAVSWIYSAMLIAAAWTIGLTHWLLWKDVERAAVAAVAAILLPMTVYLLPKFLSETPALCASVASTFLLVLAVQRARPGVGTVLALASGAMLGLAILARSANTLLFAGLWLGLVLVPPAGFDRGRLLRLSPWVGVGVALAIVALDALLGVDFDRILTSRRGALALQTPIADYVRRIVFAIGPAAIPAAIAWRTRHRAEMWHHALAAAVGIVPILVGLRFLEERYLVAGIPGLAGLVALGYEVARLTLRSRAVALAALLTLFAAGNVEIQPRMLQPFDATAYDDAVDWVAAREPKAPILAADVITEFHYLRMVHPQQPSYLVMTTLLPQFLSPGNYASSAAAWEHALTQWFGTRHAPSLERLAAAAPAPWYFIGRPDPTCTTSRFSWMKDEPRIRTVPVFEVPPYVVYRVEPIAAPHADIQSMTTTSLPVALRSISARIASPPRASGKRCETRGLICPAA